jgi:YidC/Oxa1 family membrane protein insertase
MPNIRVLLWCAFAGLLYVNYDAWLRDNPTQSPVVASAPSAVGSAAANQTATPARPGTGDWVPTVPSAAGTPAAAATSAASSATQAAPAAPAAVLEATPLLHVKTDVLDVGINLTGGELDQAELLGYPLHKDTPNIPVRLLNRDTEDSLYVLQTGLAGAGTDAAPNHLASWSAAGNSYELKPGELELRVPLTWTDGHGLSVTKNYLFKRGQYAIELDYDIHNDGAAPRQLAPYSVIRRHWDPPKRSYFDVETYSFKGPAIYDGTRSRDLKVDSTDDANFSQTITNGWLASLQHHFVTAVVPTADQAFDYKLQVHDKEYLLSATGQAVTVAPRGDARITQKLFVGPKLQSQLAVTGPNLQRTADYGKLTVIAQPLFATLNWIHGLIGNWGWSIIFVTALIKLVFFPLSQASGRSMAKMRNVAPRMKQIQETYKDDKEKLGRAMMELYKKEKINPLAGCLPMVVQIPFFIAFYWVLLESVEMRQAPFMLWVNDLSARDPYFVLPALMGAAMFAQFKLNPAPPDPMQAKIMQFMPLVMTGMMMWFPSGLVLYWLTNTVLSIAQQWHINRTVQTDTSKKR